jgi:hypothetical protein
MKYPTGRMVGVGNELYDYGQAQPQQSAPDYSQLLSALAKKQGVGGAGVGGKGAGASGSAPIAAGAGQASATSPVVGAGGSSSMGSMMASAGPWAALAAAIIANESKQRGDGNRGNSTGEHIGDLASGKVLERDMERYLPHNPAGGALKRVGMMSTPSGVVRNAKDLGSWFKGLF